MRAVNENIRRLEGMPREEIMAMAKEIGSPCELLCWVAEHRKLPVVEFRSRRRGNSCRCCLDDAARSATVYS